MSVVKKFNLSPISRNNWWRWTSSQILGFSTWFLRSSQRRRDWNHYSIFSYFTEFLIFPNPVSWDTLHQCAFDAYCLFIRLEKTLALRKTASLVEGPPHICSKVRMISCSNELILTKMVYRYEINSCALRPPCCILHSVLWLKTLPASSNFNKEHFLRLVLVHHLGSMVSTLFGLLWCNVHTILTRRL